MFCKIKRKDINLKVENGKSLIQENKTHTLTNKSARENG